jgi:predicted benzoate:H+ symporter BenE
VFTLFVLAKWAAPAWALVLALALGVTLTVIYGPAAHQILSQFSGGLH